jgi:hypothetical protein
MDDKTMIYIALKGGDGRQLVVDGPLDLWRELLLSLNLQRIEFVPEDKDVDS